MGLPMIVSSSAYLAVTSHVSWLTFIYVPRAVQSVARPCLASSTGSARRNCENMTSKTAENQGSLDLQSAAATQHTPVCDVVAPVGELEQSIEQATDAVLEEIESVYQSQSCDIAFRDHDRMDFSESVRICPANLNAVPTGLPTMAQGCDLSLWGVSLIPQHPLDVDDYLLIEFTMRRAGNSRTVTMLAQVRHKRSADSAVEVVGCQFLETYCSAAVPAIV